MKRIIYRQKLIFITCILITLYIFVIMSTSTNHIQIHTLMLGPFQTNCYILVCEKTKETIIIDPGDDIKKIINLIEEKDLIVKKILLTHAHLDHCGHTSMLMEELKKKNEQGFEDILYMHEKEDKLHKNLEMQGQMFQMKTSLPWRNVRFLDESDTISFGTDHKLQILLTPGHSPGSLCFYSKEDEFLIAGDVLFQGSIGRTDLWQGNLKTLLDSINQKLLTLPEKTIVYPGHGPRTSIAQEKANNPFLTNNSPY